MFAKYMKYSYLKIIHIIEDFFFTFVRNTYLFLKKKNKNNLVIVLIFPGIQDKITDRTSKLGFLSRCTEMSH